MRNSKTITIDKGRDKGKAFKLTEKPAYQSTMWGIRAVLLLSKSGAELPDYLSGQGLAGIGLMLGTDAKAFMALIGGIDFKEAKPLLDELLECVQFQSENGMLVDLFDIDSQIEDPTTLITLYMEVLKLHANFTPNENQ